MGQKTEEAQQSGQSKGPSGEHPARELLERFIDGWATRLERRLVVRHLLGDCPLCASVTGPLWQKPESSLDAEER